MALSSFEIFQLWSNTLIAQHLADHAPHTERLVELARRDSGDNLLASDDPSVSWLQQNVIHGIGALLRSEGFAQMPPVAVRGRLEEQRLGEYHSLNNRPGAYLSGIYVLRAPGDEAVLGTREDRRPGCITFYDPRVGMNMNAIHKDPYVNYHHTVKFEPGLLLLWPSYVSFFLHPHLSREPALRIGFDVQVSAPDGGAGS